MRLEEHEAIVLALSAVAGIAWAVAGVCVLTSWPVAGLDQLAPGDALRLVLFVPASAGIRRAGVLSAAGLPSGGPLFVPASTGLQAGLVAGLLVVRRLRG